MEIRTTVAEAQTRHSGSSSLTARTKHLGSRPPSFFLLITSEARKRSSDSSDYLRFLSLCCLTILWIHPSVHRESFTLLVAAQTKHSGSTLIFPFFLTWSETVRGNRDSQDGHAMMRAYTLVSLMLEFYCAQTKRLGSTFSGSRAQTRLSRCSTHLMLFSIVLSLHE